MATVTFDRTNKLIIVAAPDTSISVQELHDKIRNWEDEPRNMDVESFIQAAGKFDLGGGEATAVSLKLIVWKLKFEDRGSFTECQVTGGNLIGEDEHGETQSPIEQSNNTFVVIRQSTAPAAIQTGGDMLTSGDISNLAAGVWDDAEVAPADRDVDVKLIDGSAVAAQNIGTAKDSMIIGTVDDHDFTPTATEFEASDITDAVTDVYKSAVIIFTSGALKRLRTDVTAYSLVGGRGHFTVTAMPQPAADGDTFVIV